MLLVDEAHAVGLLGPLGRGLAAQLGVDQRVDLHLGTLSKAFGLSGGYLAASRNVIDLLVNRARSFIYTTAPPAHLAHALSAALEIIRGVEGDKRRHAALANIQKLAAILPQPGTGSPDVKGAILPWMIGDEAAAVRASERMGGAGFLIPSIRYPTVAKGAARLRITVSAAHTVRQIEALAEVLGTL
jgi:7-keto-8-aminopelargonate synthetase-like enzyme